MNLHTQPADFSEPGRFSFDALIEKAYTDSSGGMHVLAVPSDTLRDDQGDMLTKRCLERMAAQCRKGIDILDNHRSTFGFGITTKDSHVRPMPGQEGNYQLVVDILLDPTYPQARALFNEVMNNFCRKQLSIGGKLNRENPNAIRWERDEDGRTVRKVDDIILDHIACTRPGKAANKRTSFLAAVMKAIEDNEDFFKGGQGMSGETVEKGVVPFREYPVMRGQGWNWSPTIQNAILERGGWPMYREAHTWYDPGMEESKAGYKLPHHVLEDGRMVTHFPGTTYAMAALLGARGGTDMPRGDKQGAYGHLARHYRQANMQAPEFRFAGKVTTKKGEVVDTHKGDEEHVVLVDFEKTEVQPWGHDEFVAFHKEQGLDVEWLTKDIWEAAVAEFSPEREKQILALEEEEKAKKEQDMKDAEKGLNFLQRLGRALGRGDSDDTEKGDEPEVKISEEVEAVVVAVQELEAHAEKAEVKDIPAIRRGIALLETAVAKMAPGIEGSEVTLDLAVADEKVAAVLAKAESFVAVPEREEEKALTPADINALCGVTKTLKALDEKFSKPKEEAKGDEADEAKAKEEEAGADKGEAEGETKEEEAKEEGKEADEEKAKKKPKMPEEEMMEEGKKGEAAAKKDGDEEEEEGKEEEAAKSEDASGEKKEGEGEKGEEGVDSGAQSGQDTDKGEGTEKSDPPEDGIEKMRSIFSEEIEKAVSGLKQELRGEIAKDFEDRLVTVGEELSKSFNDLSDRLSKVEKVSGKPQGLRGTEPGADVEKGKKKGNVFSGLFDGAISKAQARM